MPIIHKDQIPAPIRNHHLQEYRRKLLEQLASPGLPESQKKAIRERLSRLGKPKQYRKVS